MTFECSRRVRAFAGWGVLFVMVFVVHGWAYKYQKCVIHINVHPPTVTDLNTGDTTVVLRPSSIFTMISTLRWFGHIFSWVFLMLCGKPLLTGSWVLCPTILQNLLTLPDSVRISL